jgi:hypothetical protein
MLGDAIAKVTHALGIEQCDDCKERQQKLNRLFGFKSPSPMTEKDKEFMARFLEWYNDIPIPIDKVNEMLEAEQIWLRLFKVNTGQCRSCGVHYQRAFINDLIKLYESYSN